MLLEFLESDTESVNDGILLCQGCASTKYPVESKMCPTCGFPNAEYRHVIKPQSPRGSGYQGNNRRPRVQSVEEGYVTSRSRNHIRASKSRNDYSTKRNDRRTEKDRAYKKSMHHDSRTRKELLPRRLDHRGTIRSGQKVPLNSMTKPSSKNKTGKKKRNDTKLLINKSTQCNIEQSDKGTSTEEKLKLSSDELSELVDYVCKAEQQCLVELLSESYNRGVAGASEGDFTEFFKKFNEERKKHLRAIIAFIARREELPPIPTASVESSDSMSSTSSASDETSPTEVIPETPRNKFLPNAQSKPKVSFDDPAVLESDTENKESRKSNSRKKPDDKSSTPINVKRKKKMSFDEHYVKSDAELKEEQERIFREARIRQGQNAFVNGLSAAEKYANRAKFDVVARGNVSVPSFQPLFLHKGLHPDPYSNNPYDILGVPSTASEAQMRRQYKSLCFLFHPDKNKHVEAKTYFEKINDAYTKVQKVLE